MIDSRDTTLSEEPLAGQPRLDAVPAMSVPVIARPPARHIAGTALAAPFVFALLVNASGGLGPLLWNILVGLIALAGAYIIASYIPLPGTGRKLNVGCTPCAGVSAFTLLGAGWFLQSGPHVAGVALAALAFVSFGTLQRLTGAGVSCAR